MQRNDAGRPASSERDHTPSAGAGLRGQPAKGMSQGFRPSITVVGGLLLLAAIIGVILWLSVRFGADETDSNPGAPAPASDVAETGGDALASADPPATDAVSGATTPVGDAVIPATGTASIAAITAYDPDGDNDENDGEAALAAADGDPSTNWRTVCYGGEYMGGKRGVGLVVSFDGVSQQALSVDVINGPYQLEFYTSTSENIPASIDGWDGQLGAKSFAAEGRNVVSDVPSTPVTHMLVLLNQIGADAGCSDVYPYRGRLGEIALVG